MLEHLEAVPIVPRLCFASFGFGFYLFVEGVLEIVGGYWRVFKGICGVLARKSEKKKEGKGRGKEKSMGERGGEGMRKEEEFHNYLRQ